MFHNIFTTIASRICVIKIDREAKLNSLNRETLKELNAAFRQALEDDEVKGIIITGSGKKAFAAGADISEFRSLNAEEGRLLSREVQTQVFDLIEKAEKPVIAAVNGFALGGGLELALACHIRIVSSTAKLGLPEVSLGLIPGYGGTQRLPALVGKGKALEMILTGDMIDAREAFQIGLANRVVEPEDLLSVSEELLKKIFERSSTAVAAAIRSVNASFSNGAWGFEKESAEFGTCFSSPDFKEGIAAFLEKRKAKFT